MTLRGQRSGGVGDAAPGFVVDNRVDLPAPGPGSSIFRDIGITWDGSEGDSGAPWYRCWGATGSCEAGEEAFPTAVWSGYHPVTNRRVGALVRNFRPWAITCMRTGAC